MDGPRTATGKAKASYWNGKLQWGLMQCGTEVCSTLDVRRAVYGGAVSHQLKVASFNNLLTASPRATANRATHSSVEWR